MCGSVHTGREAHKHTFFNNTSLFIQHTLNFTASHVHQASLIQEGLAPVEARAIEQDGSNRDQKANVMLPQPYRERGRKYGLDRERGYRGVKRSSRLSGFGDTREISLSACA